MLDRLNIAFHVLCALTLAAGLLVLLMAPILQAANYVGWEFVFSGLAATVGGAIGYWVSERNF